MAEPGPDFRPLPEGQGFGDLAIAVLFTGVLIASVHTALNSSLPTRRAAR